VSLERVLLYALNVGAVIAITGVREGRHGEDVRVVAATNQDLKQNGSRS
jgi:DNA-binding NtrC family response regulator